MADTDIQYFTSFDLNAPQLTNVWGCLIDVLDACLVNGFTAQVSSNTIISNKIATITFSNNHNIRQFQVIEISGSSIPALNSKFKVLGITDKTLTFNVDTPDTQINTNINIKVASLGWEKTYTGNQKAVYRAKDKVTNPYYLRVDNSVDPVYNVNYAKFAKVGYLETCTDIDDISGVQVPFDSANPTKNWVGVANGGGANAISGWFKWQYSGHDNIADSSGWYESEAIVEGIRSWSLIGTKDTFYLFIKMTVNKTQINPYAFGVILNNTINKPFLIATNKNTTAGSSLNAQTALGNTSLVEVGVTYDSGNNRVPNTFFSFLANYKVIASGNVLSDSIIKYNPSTDYILSPLYMVDQNKYLMSPIPLVRYSVVKSNAPNLSIHTSNNGTYYLALSYNYTMNSTSDSTMFLKIYEGT